MAVLKPISGDECIKILCNKFGFRVVRQRGSHCMLRKETSRGVVGTVVPKHPALKVGTLKGLLALATVSEEEFAQFI